MLVPRTLPILLTRTTPSDTHSRSTKATEVRCSSAGQSRRMICQIGRDRQPHGFGCLARVAVTGAGRRSSAADALVHPRRGGEHLREPVLGLGAFAGDEVEQL